MSTNIHFHLTLSQQKRNAIDVLSLGEATSESDRIKISHLFAKHVEEIQESILSHKLAGIQISGPKEKWTSEALNQICSTLAKTARISVQNRLIHKWVEEEKNPSFLAIDKTIAARKTEQQDAAFEQLKTVMGQTGLHVFWTHPNPN